MRRCGARSSRPLAALGGCADRGLASGPTSTTSAATWAAVTVATVAVGVVLAALVVLPALRPGGSVLGSWVLGLQAGGVAVASAIIVGAAVRSEQLLDRAADAEQAASILRLTSLDGRDSGFFTLIVLVTVVVGGLLIALLVLAARFAADTDPVERVLAAGLLGVEVLGSVACWVLLALGFRHAGLRPARPGPPDPRRRHRGRLAARAPSPSRPGPRTGRTVGMADDVARTDLFIGGEWRPAESGERFDVVDPGTEEVITTVANAGAADASRGGRGGGRRPARVGRHRAPAAGRGAAALLGAAHRARRRPGAPDHPRERQGARRGQGRDHLCRRVLPLVQRGGGAPVRASSPPHRAAPTGSWSCTSPSAWPTSSPRGTSRPPWPRGRSPRRWPPAAPWCSSPPRSRRSPRWRWPTCSPRPACRPASSTSCPGRSASTITAAVLEHPRVRKLSFTGSTEVGKKLIAQAADRVLNVSMELGGNAPFIVLADADLDAAIEGAMIAKMRHNGETCTAANRFYVEAPVAEAFAAKLADAMGALPTGHGLEDGNRLGPLVDADTRDKVAELVDSAVGAGAKAVVGGETPDGTGFYYPATVLTGRGRRQPDPRGGDLRAGGADRVGGRRRRGGPAGQRHHDGARRLRLHRRPRQGPPHRRAARVRAWSASTRASCPTRRRPSAA